MTLRSNISHGGVSTNCKAGIYYYCARLTLHNLAKLAKLLAFPFPEVRAWTPNRFAS
jgi:hypothetical protein